MSIRTRLFSSEDLEDALESFEEFCDDEELDADDIISVSVVSKNAEKESSVVLIYDDCTSDD